MFMDSVKVDTKYPFNKFFKKFLKYYKKENINLEVI